MIVWVAAFIIRLFLFSSVNFSKLQLESTRSFLALGVPIKHESFSLVFVTN
jgi:hypothetical protein